jgi:sulfate transport system permease protein
VSGRIRCSLPGFRLSLGFALAYLLVLVIIPLGGCILKAASLSPERFWQVVTHPQAVAAYKLIFVTSLIAGLINAALGMIAAWVLVRYEFPGKKLFDILVDLPLALPTAVAGITFGSLFVPDGWYGQYLGFLEPDGVVGYWFSANGWFGVHLFPLDVRPYDGPFAIVLVLVFVGIPFVIRSVQPVLADFEAEQEEAAAILGANRWQTVRYVVLPALLPAWLTGFALAYARGLGEYGSIIFVASNLPYETEIPPVIIIAKLEQFHYDEAAAIGCVMLLFSLATLLAISLLERWSRRFDPAR